MLKNNGEIGKMGNNKKCENCIHYEVCCKCDMYGDCADNCKSFKDKSLCVEVVRCKDCKYAEIVIDAIRYYVCTKKTEYSRQRLVIASDFCQYAERKLQEVGE